MNKKEKSAIKAMMQSREWIAIETAVEEYVKTIEKRPTASDDLWSTARKAVEKESEQRGIRRFFKYLEEFIHAE